MSEPRTKAGRALLAVLLPSFDHRSRELRQRIARVEAEAAAPSEVDPRCFSFFLAIGAAIAVRCTWDAGHHGPHSFEHAAPSEASTHSVEDCPCDCTVDDIFGHGHHQQGHDQDCPLRAVDAAPSEASTSLEEALQHMFHDMSDPECRHTADGTMMGCRDEARDGARHPAMRPFAVAHERAERLAAALRDCVDDRAILAEASPPTDSGRTP